MKSIQVTDQAARRIAQAVSANQPIVLLPRDFESDTVIPALVEIIRVDPELSINLALTHRRVRRTRFPFAQNPGEATHSM